MLKDKKQLAILGVVLLAITGAVIYRVRSPKPPAQIPTINVSDVRTAAVSTFASGLTSTADAKPSGMPSPTEFSITPTNATGTISPTPSCYNLHFVRDVTIPDNTAETPAQVFTKTWLVENNGTCDWQAGFKVVLIGGLAMGGSPFTLVQSVRPGGQIQISIKMAAPTDQKGIVQGTWRMSDDTGTNFGEAMWVTIVVGNETGTPSPIGTTATP